MRVAIKILCLPLALLLFAECYYLDKKLQTKQAAFDANSGQHMHTLLQMHDYPIVWYGEDLSENQHLANYQVIRLTKANEEVELPPSFILVQDVIAATKIPNWLEQAYEHTWQKQIGLYAFHYYITKEEAIRNVKDTLHIDSGLLVTYNDLSYIELSGLDIAKIDDEAVFTLHIITDNDYFLPEYYQGKGKEIKEVPLATLVKEGHSIIHIPPYAGSKFFMAVYKSGQDGFSWQWRLIHELE